MRYSIYILVIFSFLFVSESGYSQRNFEFSKKVKKESVSFKLMSNLIIFPMEVNGKKLNFILDSGVGSTILFNLDVRDSIKLNEVKNVKLQGLGSEAPVDAILSRNNEFRIKSIVGGNQRLYVVSNDNFDLSSKLGLTIHGIIGYELFKDFVVKVNYNTKKLSFYHPDSYEYKDCKKCETFSLEFYKLKPYINVGAYLDSVSEKLTNVKLLIDSGGSDAMWLFENSLPEIKVPKKSFRDFLGEGLSGAIYGERSKIKGLQIGKFYIPNPTVSFPDSIAIAYASKFKSRNGSMGGSVLKRFIVIFDYRHSKLTLKKGAMFKEAFRYNMCGIELAHNGKILVKEHDKTTYSLLDGQRATGYDRISLSYRYKFTFKPSYVIQKIRINSPAYEAGLQPGDLIIKVNGKSAFEIKMSEIVDKFYQKENKRLSLLVERNGQHHLFTFRLRDMLK